jgi:hypothetical protein
MDNYSLDIDKMFLALDDSVHVINTDVDAGDHSEEIDSRVWRNWKHLEIMLEKDFIINAERDLSIYQTAILKGSDFSPEKQVNND